MNKTKYKYLQIKLSDKLDINIICVHLTPLFFQNFKQAKLISKALGIMEGGQPTVNRAVRRHSEYQVKKNQNKSSGIDYNKRKFHNKTQTIIPVLKANVNNSTYFHLQESLAREVQRSKCKALVSTYIDKVIMHSINDGTVFKAIHKVVHDEFIIYAEILIEKFKLFNNQNMKRMTELEYLKLPANSSATKTASTVIDILENYNTTTSMIDKDIASAGIINEKGKITIIDKSKAHEAIMGIVNKSIINIINTIGHIQIFVKASIDAFLCCF